MNMYWVYDLPTWLFAALTIAVAGAIGVSGSYATRKWVRRVHGHEHSHNDIVGFFLGAVAVLCISVQRRYRGRFLVDLGIHVRVGLPCPDRDQAQRDPVCEQFS